MGAIAILQQRKIAFVTVLIAFVFVVVTSLRAQTTTGSIYGTISDQNNAVIPNVSITVTRVDTGEIHTLTSNESGNYSFPALMPGDYTVSAHAQGFSTQTQRNIRLDVSQNEHISFTLKPGATSDVVTVTADATMIDTRESQLGETVDQKRIQDLPLNGRNAYSLVQLVPGVTNYTGESAIGDQNGSSFSVNGIRTALNSFYLDGVFDTAIYRDGGNLIPNPDAVHEFRLLTSNFDAEFGRAPGGVVNLITRSGTNNFHGLLYDYLRNNVLNAKSYFNNSVTPLKQNQFGGNVGGPFLRDKLFFFFSYEGLRVASPTTVAAASLVTPTPAEAMGDLSAMPQSQWPKLPNGTLYNCNGKQGVICPNVLDPVAQNLLKTVPLSDPATGHPVQQTSPGNNSANQYLIRGDYQITPQHSAAVMFFNSHGTGRSPTAGSNQILDFSGVSQKNAQTNAMVSETWMVSANKLNNIRVFYSLNHNILGNLFDNNTLSDLGSQAPAGSGLTTQPQISITGYWSMGSGSSGVDNQAQQAIGLVDSFNWTHANHDVKFGGSFLWSKYAETGGYAGSGQWGFTGSTTGNALADFLLGNANSWRQNSGVFHRLHAPDPALFIQDDWRIARKLTLNLGLRWEAFAPFTGQNDFGTFSPNVQSRRFPTAPLGILAAGDPGVPDGIIHTQWKDFAPRVGFAYDVFGDGKTSLRGAYGLFYAASQATFSANLEQQPFLLDITINKTPNLVTPFTPGLDPFPYVVNLQNPTFRSGAATVGLAPNAGGTPYVHEYSLALQQQLGSQWAAQVSYVGNGTRKAYLLRDANSPVYIPGASTSTTGLNSRRPYQPTPDTYAFGSIAELTPAGNSSYNALQIILTRRFAHNFSLSANYVWSKTIDFVSADPGSLSGTSLVDNNDINRDRGLSTLDVPQRFVASYLWTTPVIHRWGFVGREALSGWQLNGITTLSTGSPFNVTSGVDSNLDGSTNDRPNVTGDPRMPGARSRSAKIQGFFNTAAFSPVPAGVPYGNTPRDLLVGPGFVNTDFSAFKNFPVWNEHNLQFRGELFNLFNNVNLNNPNGTRSSSQFGKITGSGSPRIVQFSLRYSF